MGFEQFNDKVVVVTGAASGLGMGISEAVASGGASVVAADINGEAVQKVVDRINEGGTGKAESYNVNVAKGEEVVALIENTVAKYGRIDYIFNNAGIAVQGPVEDIPLENWDSIIDINLRGVAYGTSAAYKQMLKQGHGHIVNTASLAGLVPSPLLAPYSAVKFGVVGMTESLRLEAKKKNIQVTALCPGFIDTGIYENAKYSGGLNAELGRGQIPVIVPLDKGVRILLEGVLKNKRIVTLPFYGHLFWWSYRLFPAVTNALSGLLVARQKKAAKKGRAAAA